MDFIHKVEFEKSRTRTFVGITLIQVYQADSHKVKCDNMVN